PVVEQGVGRDLDARRGFAAIHAAAAGGEHANVAAAADQASHAHGIVTGRVHETETARGDRLGVAINRGQRRLATFSHRAQTFFINGGQTTLLVAVGRIVVWWRYADG